MLATKGDLLKKACVLKGIRNVGKTRTIRTAAELLRTKYPEAIVEHEHRTRVELRVVLNINGLKIGIESHGDPNSRLIKESLDFFVRIGCDVIICATRTSGMTVDAVKALTGYEIVWLEQRPQSTRIEQVFRDLATARYIAEETEKSITSAKLAVLTHAAGRQ
jgi:hypothetical protein